MSGYACAPVGAFDRSRSQFEALLADLFAGGADGLTHAQVEQLLQERERELFRQVMQELLDLRAAREPRRGDVVGYDMVARTRVERAHQRGLSTVFGPVTVTRLAYRAPWVGNLYPSDARQNLPDDRYSYGLRRLVVVESVRGSFDDAGRAVERATGVRLGKRQVEALAAGAALDVDAFYAQRRPNHAQITAITTQARHRDVRVHIVLDFIHVLQYLWKAARARLPAGPATERWVTDQATKILHGHATQVATDLRHTATSDKATTSDKDPALACADYLTNNQPYLNYHHALSAGWPIATGVIEGACRHLIKDRMDITGARWGLTTAEAILKLRALTTNDDFDDYWQYHQQQQHQRIHQTRYLPPCQALTPAA